MKDKLFITICDRCKRKLDVDEDYLTLKIEKNFKHLCVNCTMDLNKWIQKGKHDLKEN
jgi:hypothetical protein